MTKSTKAIVALIWLAIAFVPLIYGLEYYRLPSGERPFSFQYDLLKPSGLIGQGMGIVGSLMIIVGVATYSVRKRSHSAQRYGKLRNWLTFHIFLCTLGPFLILLHSTFKIGNIAAIAFWSMSVVVGSGVFGRYVYQHIPKGLDGVFYGPDHLEAQKSDIVNRLSLMTGEPADAVRNIMASYGGKQSRGLVSAIASTVRFDMGMRHLTHGLALTLKDRGVDASVCDRAIPVFIEGLRLDHSVGVSGPMQKLFGYWHVFHIPLAIVMLITFLVHVGVAIAFGYTWIF